ncbi:MAG: rhodanese-like domain-containing protein [Arenibacter sp.]|nr:rhodanese-like domain-containing protein [Eudoraea sp.]NNG08871.1 rhodanese-like domain-containing protein [Arenibacter sp.]
MQKNTLSLLFLLLTASLMGQRTMEKTLAKLVKGDVPLVYVTELSVNDSYMKLDAREKEEFDVSHLPSAHYIGYEDFDPKKMVDLVPGKNATIVVYCSIGIRSEKIGKKLMALGYTNVKNLAGGIIQWKNEGQPVVDNFGIETEKIHTYNRLFGLLLNKGEKVFGSENN